MPRSLQKAMSSAPSGPDALLVPNGPRFPPQEAILCMTPVTLMYLPIRGSSVMFISFPSVRAPCSVLPKCSMTPPVRVKSFDKVFFRRVKRLSPVPFPVNPCPPLLSNHLIHIHAPKPFALGVKMRPALRLFLPLQHIRGVNGAVPPIYESASLSGPALPVRTPKTARLRVLVPIPHSAIPNR